MLIEIKNVREIDAIRVASKMAAETLALVGESICVGMSTDDVNALVHIDTIKKGAYPAPLNYHGFPKSVCTSVNDVVCHGIPSAIMLNDGDIVNVDVTTVYKGFFGDTSATFYIGVPSAEAKLVVETARKALELGIAEVKNGAFLGDVGAAIQEYVESQGCNVVRDFVGHGIGRRFHERAQVKHYGMRGTGDILKAGMVFTIEPMVNFGTLEVKVGADDKWTVKLQTVHYQHNLNIRFQSHKMVIRYSRNEELKSFE